MRHNLPTVPIFRDTPAGSQIEELALRVVVELPNWELHVIGTATVIGGHLALTARHVLSDAMKWLTTKINEKREVEAGGGCLQLLQVLPGPIYRFWRVVSAWVTSSDIAILHLNLDRTSEPNAEVSWRTLALRATPPPSGEKVIAFGYRQSTVKVTKDSAGQSHIEIDDKPTTSAGVVGQIFPVQRDSGMLNFPCFEVHAQFAPGMSGGVVVDEEGRLCGLVCAEMKFLDPNHPPLSYAATLWPFLTTLISADRGDAYPRGVKYPAIDLALDGIINMNHLEDLDPALFPGRTLPQR
jgi:Trypsin-like peptidase domain